MSELDEYYYARDHAAGTGQWCVRGPGLDMSVPDKNLAYAIGKLLSGKIEDADSMAKDYVKYLKSSTN